MYNILLFICFLVILCAWIITYFTAREWKKRSNNHFEDLMRLHKRNRELSIENDGLRRALKMHEINVLYSHKMQDLKQDHHKI